MFPPKKKQPGFEYSHVLSPSEEAYWKTAPRGGGPQMQTGGPQTPINMQTGGPGGSSSPPPGVQMQQNPIWYDPSDPRIVSAPHTRTGGQTAAQQVEAHWRNKFPGLEPHPESNFGSAAPNVGPSPNVSVSPPSMVRTLQGPQATSLPNNNEMQAPLGSGMRNVNIQPSINSPTSMNLQASVNEMNKPQMPFQNVQMPQMNQQSVQGQGGQNVGSYNDLMSYYRELLRNR